MGRLSAYERGRGRVGETWFPLRERAEGERRSCRESFRFAAMLARDLFLVGTDEMPVAHDLLAGDVEPLHAVRPREDESGHLIRGSSQLQSVRAPDRKVGALAGRKLADVVPAEYRCAATRAEAERVARRQRLGATPRPRHQQGLLHLEKQVAALVRRGTRDPDVGDAELRDLILREVHAVSAPDVPGEPAQLLDVLDGCAAEFLQRVLLLLGRLGEMRVQAEAEPARELCRFGHQLTGDREGGAGRHGDVDLCAVREGSRLFGGGEGLVAFLDDPVRREAAVGFAEVHRAARGEDAHAELASGADLRLEQARRARWKHVVVVEDRRATGQRQFGEARARGCVLRLLVDPRPHRVERLQPTEEVLLLRSCSRQVLPEVVVRVHEPGRNDRAAEVDHLVCFRLRVAADVAHVPIVHQEPTACVLARVVIHGDDVRIDEERRHTFSGTSSKRSTSTSPRSVIFRLGITDSPRNESVRKGVAPDQPSARAASLQARLCSITSASGASASNPATGSGSSAATSPPSITTMPPPSSPRRSTARTMSASAMPTTTMLWASCATVEARAPRCKPEPCTKPRPIRPVPRWRSITAIFARSLPESATAAPSAVAGSSTSASVITWSGTSPITRTLPPVHGMWKSLAVTG